MQRTDNWCFNTVVEPEMTSGATAPADTLPFNACHGKDEWKHI
jgi:hypothetical protein